MSDKTYLDKIPAEDFNQLVPKRRAIIEKASDEFPKYDYNANVLARNLHPKVQHVVISEIHELPGAKCYTLTADPSCGTDKLAYFRAGQYISLSLNIGNSVLTRPYSLCASPSEALSGTYRIVVKNMKNGFAYEYINSKLKVGDKLDISAPSGFFYYEPLRDSSHIVGVAGGSGIAPFMSLAAAVADGTESFSLTLLYGSRTEEEILFRDELDSLCARSDRIKVVHVLSDEEKDGFEHGFISSELIAKYGGDSGSYSVFVCGSQGMYDYIQGETDKLGLPRRSVRFDAYGEYRLQDRDSEFTGQYSGKTFELTVVTNDGIERKVPARSDESLLVALERAGIKAPSKCRSGECGFCRSKLSSGEVYTPGKVEHRREYDRKNGYIHPCCTFPKSDCRILINYEEAKIERKVKDMKKKERIMGLVMSIIISAAMGALAAFLVLKSNPDAAKLTPVPAMYISNILMSVTVGVIVALVVPLGRLGRNLAAKANANPPGMKFTLLNAIPLSVGNTIIVSFFVSLFGVLMSRLRAPAEALANMPPFFIMWLGNWARLLLPTLILSYLLAVILSPLVSQMVGVADAGAEVGRASSGNDGTPKEG